jgi:hypothetical protein
MSDKTDLILEDSYSKVFNKSKLASNFDEVQLKNSLSLFDYNKFRNIYTPKYLNVNALLGGIEFSNDLQKFCSGVQRHVDDIIQTNSKYWVPTKNLGVEYLVTKWPEEKKLSLEMEAEFLDFIGSFHLKKYKLRVKGFQVNLDGCVVLRGYEEGNILRIRAALQERFDWIPKRQSGWAHIPLGRIFCKLPEMAYLNLVSESEKSFEDLYFEEDISQLHYVDEMQWYMETKSIIKTIDLVE